MTSTMAAPAWLGIRKGRRSLLVLAMLPVTVVMLTVMVAWAQSAIAGVVKDTSGAVLPGVTVEASSPALIEKTRTVVSDGTGQYKIIDLRPGLYAVTFTLAGFSPLQREGIELSAQFTATVNAELTVGSVEETLTVSGTAPVVDVQRTSQSQVLAKEILDAVPIQRMAQSY